MTSCLVLMDNVFRILDLVHTDAKSPRRVTFNSSRVPSLGRRKLMPNPHVAEHMPYPPGHALQTQPGPVAQPARMQIVRSFVGPRLEDRKGCPCKELSLGAIPSQARSTPTWMMTPGWNPTATYAEIRQEESRRLVWNSIASVGIDAAARFSLGMPQLDLHISDLRNVGSLSYTEFDRLTKTDNPVCPSLSRRSHVRKQTRSGPGACLH